MEVDLDTLAAVDTGVVYGTFLRNTAWVEVPNDPDLPGVSLATVQFGGSVAYMNLTTKQVKAVPYPVKAIRFPFRPWRTVRMDGCLSAGTLAAQGRVFHRHRNLRDLPDGSVGGHGRHERQDVYGRISGCGYL